MKIAILSDSHDNFCTISDAVKQANDANCEALLFAGDLVAPSALEYLCEFKGHIHFIWGNNEGEKAKITQMIEQNKNVILHGETMEEDVGGLKFFMTHYPRIGQIAAGFGGFDVVVYGHDHIYHEEKVGDTLLLNPGELHGQKRAATFMILDTETKTIEKITIS